MWGEVRGVAGKLLRIKSIKKLPNIIFQMWGEVRGVAGKLLRIKSIKNYLKSICRLISVTLYFRRFRGNLLCWQTQSLNMNIKMLCRNTFLTRHLLGYFATHDLLGGGGALNAPTS